MHNETVIMSELFYDWQGYKNINENGTHTADTNDNISWSSHDIINDCIV